MEMMEKHNDLARERVEEIASEGAVFFTDYSYYTAILGVTSDNRIVYDYNKMVDYLVTFADMNTEEAEDWISYNTIGSCVYDNSPIIVYTN